MRVLVLRMDRMLQILFGSGRQQDCRMFPLGLVLMLPVVYVLLRGLVLWMLWVRRRHRVPSTLGGSLDCAFAKVVVVDRVDMLACHADSWRCKSG